MKPQGLLNLCRLEAKAGRKLKRKSGEENPLQVTDRHGLQSQRRCLDRHSWGRDGGGKMPGA